jgi:glycosyltransferase involved in cell wall biosynthesis
MTRQYAHAGMPSSNLDRVGEVALAHDYLNQRGGSERVVLELLKLWPSAPLYTLTYRAESTYPEFADYDVRTSPLRRVRGLRTFRALAPLYPLALRSFGTIGGDLVVSSSTGWSHQIRTSPHTVHVVYCHAVPRWIHETDAYFRRRHERALARPLTALLRRLDRAAAQRADAYVVNSAHTGRQIRRFYGLDAEVIYPPVDVDRFTPGEPGERLLIVSRLFPYKGIDLAVEAANRAGIGLDVVGAGPSLEPLRELAGPTVTFHGRLDDAAVTELLEGCRALCLPATEDFGIAPVEANAAGKPVIAFAAGGALETQQEGVTAVFFRERSPDSLLEAIRALDRLQTSPAVIAAAARRFSPAVFRQRFQEVVERALAAATMDRT